jgi:hypothetical protein
VTVPFVGISWLWDALSHAANVGFLIAAISGLLDTWPVSDHRHPWWLPNTSAARLAAKLLRPFAELGFVAGFMCLLAHLGGCSLP